MTARYSSLKPSKNKFNGQIPSHWNDVPIRSVCKFKSIQNNIGEELLSVFLDRGVVRYSDTSGKQVHKPSEDMSKYQLVEPRDIVLNNQQAWRGSVGVSQYRGIVSPAYIVMSLDKSINDRFVNYMIRNQACVAQFVLASKGVGSIQRILSPTKLKSSFFTLPPREEQDQIVRYLDWQVSKINKLINANKKHIFLLVELKKSVVSHVVSRGLDPNAEMKYSGIEWLGNIPKHWKITKLRQILHPVTQKNRPDLPLLSVVREQGVIIRDVEDKESNHNFIPDDLSGYKVVRQGQFTMNKMKAWQGSYGVSDYTGIVSPAYFVFDVEFPNLQYFHYAIRSKVYVNFFAQASDGIRVGQWDLSMEKMKEIPFLVPPTDEQEAIVEYIPKMLEKYDSQIQKLNEYVECLQEYKNNLISRAITGKIDVRSIDIPEYDEVEESFDEELSNDNIDSSEVD